MKSKFFTPLLLIIILPLAGLVIYVNNSFLPIKGKAILTQRLSGYFDKDVEIERLKYSPFKGIVLENVTIGEDLGEAKRYFVKIKEISGNFFLLPIFREKKFIIPKLHIESAQFYLVRKEDQTLNLLELFKKKFELKVRHYSLLINKIIISDGRCFFRDESLESAYEKEINDLKIGLEFGPSLKVNFLFEGKISSLNNDILSIVNFSGTYDSTLRQVQSNLVLSRFPVNEYLQYLKKSPILFSAGFVEKLDLKADLALGQKLELKGKIIARNLELRKGRYYLSGSINIFPELKYTFIDKKLDYRGEFKLSDVKFLGLDYLKDISDIKGKISLEENKIWSDNLRIKFAGLPFEVKGVLVDFSNPYLKLEISTDRMDLEKLKQLLTVLPKNLTLSGKSTLNMDIRGLIKEFPSQLSATSQIISGKITSPYLEESLHDIKGKIGFSLNKLTWQDITFLYKHEAFKSTGQLINFQYPDIELMLSSKDLFLNTDFFMRDQSVKINNCSGKYLNSIFSLKGNLQTQTIENPLIELELKSDLWPKDIFTFLSPQLAKKFSDLKLGGICKVNGNLKGRLKDVKNWNCAFNLFSPSLSVYDLKLENLRLKLSQKNKLLEIDPLSAKVYDGNLNAKIDSNLGAEKPLLKTKITLSNVDLARLKMDTELKDKDLSGTLSTQMDIQANLDDLGGLKGGGFVSIKEAEIWQLDIFKKISDLLYLPIQEKGVFRRTYADFVFKDRAVETDNLFFDSENFDLLCRGRVNFDKRLALTLNAQISKDLLKKSSANLRKLVARAYANLINIDLAGTIEAPVFKISRLGKPAFRKIRGFFSNR